MLGFWPQGEIIFSSGFSYHIIFFVHEIFIFNNFEKKSAHNIAMNSSFVMVFCCMLSDSMSGSEKKKTFKRREDVFPATINQMTF